MEPLSAAAAAVLLSAAAAAWHCAAVVFLSAAHCPAPSLSQWLAGAHWQHVLQLWLPDKPLQL